MVSEPKEQALLTDTLGLGVSDLWVSYGISRQKKTILHGVTFNVSQGEIIALTGPSGCGKSTLLRAIAGLAPVDAGTISWNGQSLERVPTHRRDFGLMFQDGQLFAHLSVAKNVAYGMVGRGLSKLDRQARVEQLLQLVGLPGFEHRAVTQLSGGERQRIALARALAAAPKLLLLDEPLSALDRELRERLAEDLVMVLKETHTTAIMVTHDEHEARAVASRTLRMGDGNILG